MKYPQATDTAPSATAATLPDKAIEIRGLEKTYRHRERKTAAGPSTRQPALCAVDLDVPRGSLFGLLGPNGAGKSTLINILAGLVIKSGGQARVWDIDIDQRPRAARAAIGVVPQELNLDAFFTPGELLEVQAGLYGVPPRERRTREILAAVGLSDKANAYARDLSGGMRRRLLVAKALVHNPPVLVLDEPTAGVDIELRRQLWDYVRELHAAGTTVVLTTHYLEEAEALCDRIAIINAGRLIACDTTRALIGRLDDKEMRVTLESDPGEIPAALKPFQVTRTGPRDLTIRYRKREVGMSDILGALAAAGLSVADLSTEEPDLEDIFLRLTGSDRDSGLAA